MFVLLRNLLTISILFLSTSFLYARDVVITEDTFKQENDKVAFLFGLFGSSSDEDEETEEESNSGLAGFNFSNSDEEQDFEEQPITQEQAVENADAQDLEIIDINEPTPEVETQEKKKNIIGKPSDQKSLRGKTYYLSASYSLLLKGRSVTDYFSMEEEDPEDDENDNLVPVYSTDEFNAAKTPKTTVAIGKYYSSKKSYLEFEYTKFYMRATDYNGGSTLSASDDRIYRSWVSGLAIWKRDLIDFNMIGMRNSSPLTAYSILGAGYTYTTLSKKETNKIQLAYTLGLGLSWRLNSFATLYGDLRHTSNISTMQTFSQGYDQSHNVKFTDLNFGARFFIF